MLTKRQKKTIEHLQEFLDITTPDNIIHWCQIKLRQPKFSPQKRQRGIITRDRPKSFYQEIIREYLPLSEKQAVRTTANDKSSLRKE